MTVTPATFKARYTEFSTLSDARIQIFLDDAALEMDSGRWGDLYDRGQAALAAHLLALAERGAAGSTTGISGQGPLTSRSVGDVSVGFGFGSSGGGNSSTEASYMSTVYGQDYWRLVQIVGFGAVVVTC
jgi:hypothetical protein